MVFDGCHFTYGDFNSKEYNLVFAHCNTEEFVRMSGSITPTYFFNKKDKRRTTIDDNYKDFPLSFQAEIMTCDATPISIKDRMVIEKTLFNRSNMRRLYIDPDDDPTGMMSEVINGVTKRLFFRCSFMNPSRIENGDGQTVGYECTIECDSGMLWQDTVEQKFDFREGSGRTVSLTVDSAVDDFIYPDVIIQVGSAGGDISIANTTDDAFRLTKFVQLPPNTRIVMQGDMNYISGQLYDKFSAQNFVRLIDGENILSVTGDIVTMTVQWNNRKFVL